MANLIHKEISSKIIEAYYQVYNHVGIGFDKDAYINALEIALSNLGLTVQTKQQIPIYYFDKSIGSFQADFLINRQIIIMVSNHRELQSRELTILQNQINASNINIDLGLLLNFGDKPQHKRRIGIRS